MTEEQKLDLMKNFKELNVAEYTTKYGDYYGLMFAGAEIATKELQEENERLKKESEENQDLATIAYMQGAGKYKTKLDKAKEIIQDLLSNSDEYARQRAMDWLKEK